MTGEGREDGPVVPGFETGLELARLKRLIAEQAAELQEYKHRCERIQRFLSTRPEEVRRLGEAELADVIERDKKLCDEARRLSQRAETLTRRESELDERGAALDREQRELKAREKSFEESVRSERAAVEQRLSRERAALQSELEQLRLAAETAAAREFETAKRLKEAGETIKLMTQKLKLAELEQAAMRERIESWERKSRDLELALQDLKSERQRLATEQAALSAREKAVDLRASQLEHDHQQRRQALDHIKEQMRAEIGELARQYRPKA